MTNVWREAMNSLTNADVTDDTAGILAFLDAQADVAAGPVGCVGYCMSGRYVTTVAGRYPTRIKAAASMYGVGIVTDKEDSPHLLLDQVQGELLFIFAGDDRGPEEDDQEDRREGNCSSAPGHAARLPVRRTPGLYAGTGGGRLGQAVRPVGPQPEESRPGEA